MQLALRTVHIVAMALVLGGIAFGIPDGKTRAAFVVTAVSGVLLLAIDLVKSGVFLYQGAGVAALLKLGLLGLGHALPQARFELYLVATVVASVGSHMSGAWRHYSFLDGKVLTQD